jgi:hypothetical protein
MGKDKIKTLEKAIVAMQAKIEESIPVFKTEPLAQWVTVGTGQKMMRQNPAVAEFRALVKDYAQAIRTYGELANSEPAEVSSLEDLRAKLFKVAK